MESGSMDKETVPGGTEPAAEVAVERDRNMELLYVFVNLVG